jgi:uncharacterized Rossmann fold enzyme
MGLIREPKGVDFVIQSKPLTEEDEIMLSAYIKRRKLELAKEAQRKLRASRTRSKTSERVKRQYA